MHGIIIINDLLKYTGNRPTPGFSALFFLSTSPRWPAAERSVRRRVVRVGVVVVAVPRARVAGMPGGGLGVRSSALHALYELTLV